MFFFLPLNRTHIYTYIYKCVCVCVYKSKLIYSQQADEIVTQIARPFTFNNCVIVLRCEHGRNKVANINCSNRSYRVITPAFCYLDSPFLFPITLSTFCLFFCLSFCFVFVFVSPFFIVSFPNCIRIDIRCNVCVCVTSLETLIAFCTSVHMGHLVALFM